MSVNSIFNRPKHHTGMRPARGEAKCRECVRVFSVRLHTKNGVTTCPFCKAKYKAKR